MSPPASAELDGAKNGLLRQHRLNVKPLPWRVLSLWPAMTPRVGGWVFTKVTVCWLMREWLPWHSNQRLAHDSAALQRQNAKNLKQIFPEKEYRGLSPNYQIHVSVSELYIPTLGLPFLLEDRSWEYINCSQTHGCGNWGWGRAIPRKGIYKRNCRCSAGNIMIRSGLLLPGSLGFGRPTMLYNCYCMRS